MHLDSIRRPMQLLLRHRRWSLASLGIAMFLVAGTTTVVLLWGGGDSPPAEPAATPTATATSTPTSTPTRTPTATPTATPVPTLTPTPSPTPAPAPAAQGAAAPVRTPVVGVSAVRIPRFGVDSAAEWIGLLWNNQLDTPHNPLNTGWYSIYDEPGQGGNAVFSAHVDYYPNIRGPFYDLDQLVSGDQVVVVLRDGTELTYEVFSNRRYDVSDVPMGEVIWPSNRPAGEEWITLITCGGRFQPNNGTSGPGRYLDRDVVVARRIS